MKIGSLCSGYGGLDIAVEALTGAETAWFSEFDRHAAKVFETHWNIPNFGDLTKVDWSSVEPIDILTGGYPCQPFSNAGKREGTNDARHIFPYIRNAIAHLQPRFVFLENVRGHLTLGFDQVLQDLAEIGYDAKWTLARASAASAPHRRERLFIIAEPTNANNNGFGKPNEEWNKRQPQFEFVELGNNVANTYSDRLQENDTQFRKQFTRHEFGKSLTPNTFDNQQSRVGGLQELGSGHHTRADLQRMYDFGRYANAITRWEQIRGIAPSPIENDKLSPKFVEWMMGLPNGWVTNVDISRTQQMKILGNGVVPQQAYMAYEYLLGLQ